MLIREISGRENIKNDQKEPINKQYLQNEKVNMCGGQGEKWADSHLP